MTIQLNLLPPSVVRKRYLISRLKIWGAVCLATLLFTFYFCLSRQRQLSELQNNAVWLHATTTPLREIEAENRRMELQIRRIKERESWLTDSDSSQTLQLLGLISHATGENHGRVSVRTLALNTIDRPVMPLPNAENRPVNAKEKAKIKYEQRMQLDLTGVAVDDIAVASFVSALRDSGVFESVELKSSLSHLFDGQEVREYSVSCLY